MRLVDRTPPSTTRRPSLAGVLLVGAAVLLLGQACLGEGAGGGDGPVPVVDAAADDVHAPAPPLDALDATAVDGALPADARDSGAGQLPDSAPGADARDEAASPEDTEDPVGDAQRDTSSDGGAPDAGEGPCALPALAAAFQEHARPFAGPCRSCHDMTAPPDLLKAPGPPWFHPTDAAATVTYLTSHGLVSAHPLSSRLLLKPLALADGGLPHSGGDLFEAGTPAHEGFVSFLEAAAPCVP